MCSKDTLNLASNVLEVSCTTQPVSIEILYIIMAQVEARRCGGVYI